MNNIIFCGDTFLLTRDGGNPFSHILSLFRDEFVCLNLETSLVGENRKEKHVCLSVGEDNLRIIPESVGIISLVNNHVYDSGNPARFVYALKSSNKIVIGPENPSVAHMALGGKDVDFFSAYFNLPRLRVSYSGGLADLLERMLLKSVAHRKIVNLHWGYEHTDVPAPFQRDLAHRLIDAGADIIIGHHTHVPQGSEVYKGKTICYSLGNFNFWQFGEEPTENNRWGYMVQYDLDSGESKPIPYRININYQPIPVSRDEEEDLVIKIERLSQAIQEIDYQVWFNKEYTNWYSREIKIWKCECIGKFLPLLWIKWIAWLCMPMQLKYYTYLAQNRMLSILWRK